MSDLSRRDWMKLTGAASGALLLPNVTGILGVDDQTPAAGAQAVKTGREKLLADFGWKFHLGHANDPTKDFNFGRSSGIFSKSGSLMPGGGRGTPGIAQPGFDTAAWSSVDLPHDWAVDLPFVEDRAVNGHGAKPLGRNYPETSVGWYRREFTINPNDLGRRISLEFDGVFRDSTVILNGHYIGRNLSGYAPFRFDVTDFVTYVTRDQQSGTESPGKNVLLVRVDATEGEGWFYEGAGIYRHVWLVKTAPVHVAPDGVFVTTDSSTPNTGAATIKVTTEVTNDSAEPLTVVVASSLFETDFQLAAAKDASMTLAPWTSAAVSQTIPAGQARRWSVEHPSLHRVQTTITSGGRRIDTLQTVLGIRTITWDADKGVFLNGEHVKIQGTCNHQDHAGVGSGLPDALQDFRIAKLKAMGCNAYRTSHNPPTPELLDACDRLGMLVLDETRMMSANEEGLSQLERLIKRDRNHPSVFCWSIGNEEPEQGTDRGARIAETMKRKVHDLDPSRLITEAMNNSWGRGLSNVVDVQGFNYGNGKGMDDYHAAHPKQFAMGTETASTVSTRGIYENDNVKGYVSAYDVNHPPWATTAEDWWTTYDARPWASGGFVWTGFDYRGEPTTNSASQGWPCISSHFGILDTCGFPKDLFYYYRSWWTNEPVLHLFPHWNWAGKEGQEIDVWVFSNLDSVELFVNGKSVGAQTMKKNSHLSWKVPYAPGFIEARGTKTGKPPIVVRRETTGSAAAIQLVPDRTKLNANGEDLSVVEVRVIDANGRIVPTADHQVTFKISGEGRFIGVGNGDPSSHEADRVPPGSDAPWTRKAFNGLCMVLAQSSRAAGEIRVEAAAPGLTSAAVTIATAAPAASRGLLS